jgi:predicted alpha/beta-hydrolase family hydrolase
MGMSAVAAEPVSIELDDGTSVSGLALLPPGASACFVLAHGAGAGMRHSFLETVAAQLASAGIGTLRYQFPYMERKSRRVDPPDRCHATVRAAVETAAKLAPGVSLFAGGKSFGGRMTSQAQSVAPLPGVRGIVFIGFPLHPANKPSDTRGRHLVDVSIPMLFLQGTRDELADLALIQALARRLGDRATLKAFDDADHSFHVRASSGRTDREVMIELVRTVKDWIDAVSA